LATGAAITTSDTASGWLVGAGFEYGLSQNWTARIAYDYIAVGDRTGAGPIANSNIKVSNDIQMLTLGINYKF
jgi:outer membrane immunogenic protein